jgi:DNA (cytosine-5)-methyltransferase 1
MREAARLQTFPDSFRFISDNIRDLSAMIGSAVPPLLAKKIAWSVSRYLDDVQFSELSPEDRKLVNSQATDAVLKRLHGTEWGHDAARVIQSGLFSHENELTT